VAGERATNLMGVAARAAGRMTGRLERIEDAWAAPEQPRFTPDDLKARLDAAGHRVGGGFDGCKVCVELVNALPSVIGQMAQEPQETA
jgi:hypothetical protein